MECPAEADALAALLRRLRQGAADDPAWNEFVEHYGGLVRGWCRRWGLQEADAEDVVQTVLLELARQLPSFVLDPAGSFRAWLRTVALRSWRRQVAGPRRARTSLDLDRLPTPGVGTSFLCQLETDGERELLALAMRVVRAHVAPRTWMAFVLTTLQERPAAEVAARLGMKAATVLVARSKVQRRLREEIRRLTGADEA